MRTLTLSRILLLVLCVISLPSISGIFADQVGEVEFLQQHIGEPIATQILSHDKHFIVTSSRGVLASINQQAGSLRWRKVLHEETFDAIAIAKTLIVTLSQQSTLQVLRGWDIQTGALIWETPLPLESSTVSDIKDLSYDAVANSINVLSKNSVMFFNTAGNLQWKFTPAATYSASSLKHSKTHGSKVSSGELRLVLSQLVHPSEATAVTSQEMFAAVGCFVTTRDSTICSHTTILKVHHVNQLGEFLVFPALSVAPAAIQTNLRSAGDLGPFDVLFAIDRHTPSPAMLLLHVAPSALADLLTIPIPAADKTSTFQTFSLQASAASAAFAGISACSAEGLCGSYLYYPRPDETDTLIRSLFNMNTCQSASPGQSVVGLSRSPSHSSLAATATCASVSSDRSINILTSSLAPSRVISSHTESIELPAGLTAVPLKSINVALNAQDNKLASLLTSTQAQVLLSYGNQVISLQEESLAYTLQALIVTAPVAASFSSDTVPDLTDRLALQRELLAHYLASTLSFFRHIASVLTSMHIGTIGTKIMRGGFRSDNSDKHVLFGFNKLAVCLTSADALQSLKIVAIDLLREGAVQGIFIPKLPSGVSIASAKLLRGDDAEKVIILAVVATSGQAFFWDISVAQLHDATGGVIYRAPSMQLDSVKVKSIVSVGKKSGRRFYGLVLEGGQVTMYPSLPLEQTRAQIGGLFFHDLPEPGNEGVFSSLQADASSCAAATDAVTLCSLRPVASAVFPPASERILSVVYPNSEDNAMSRTSTLMDQSLLLKYLNPHAIVIISQSIDATQGVTLLVITVIDSVSARILYRSSQPHGEEPVHAVMIENCIVVSYWNQKAQRTEISSIALYEGMVGKYDLGPFSSGNAFSNEGPFSSFSALPPISLQKTFIAPKAIAAFHRTLTASGLSNKHLLMGTVSGQISAVDLRLLNPRRPLAVPSKTEKDEGLQQYSPFLYFPPNDYISYNATVVGITQLETAPSNLESTSVLLAFGLDVFYNHHRPSRSFDLLSSDFNHTLLVIILGGLFAAVLMVTKMAKKKTISTMWA